MNLAFGPNTGSGRAFWRAHLITGEIGEFRCTQMRVRPAPIFSSSREYAFISEWSRVPLLFIDDLGNNRLTPSMGSALFGVLNNRFAHARPTIFTMQFLFRELRKTFENEKLAEALEPRIAEHGEVVFLNRRNVKK